MDAERQIKTPAGKVEEFYWNGRLIVYVDNRLTDESFDTACCRLTQKEDPS